jgi:hypothetical protein
MYDLFRLSEYELAIDWPTEETKLPAAEQELKPA